MTAPFPLLVLLLGLLCPRGVAPTSRPRPTFAPTTMEPTHHEQLEEDKMYENVTNFEALKMIGPRIFEAVHVWREFQEFALNHSSMLPSRAEWICNRFEAIDIRNFTRIGDTQRMQRMITEPQPAKRKTKVLFLTTKRSLLLLSDRWYFELYMGLATQPDVDAVMWGVGMPGFRDELTTKENLMRWFADPEFDIVHSTWTYQRTIRGVEDQGSGKGVGHPKGRSREFGDLPGNPLITLVVQEVAMNMDELLVQPHIVFVVYEQQMGVGPERLVDTCGHLGSTSTSTGTGGSGNATMISVVSGGCGLNPVIAKIVAQAPNKTMVAFLPHGVHVPKVRAVDMIACYCCCCACWLCVDHPHLPPSLLCDGSLSAGNRTFATRPPSPRRQATPSHGGTATAPAPGAGKATAVAAAARGATGPPAARRRPHTRTRST